MSEHESWPLRLLNAVVSSGVIRVGAIPPSRDRLFGNESERTERQWRAYINYEDFFRVEWR